MEKYAVPLAVALFFMTLAFGLFFYVSKRLFDYNQVAAEALDRSIQVNGSLLDFGNKEEKDGEIRKEPAKIH